MDRSTLRIVISILTLITVAIHLGLVLVLEGSMQIMFVLNGIGYIGLLWAFLRPPAFLSGQTVLVHYAYIAFATVTIIGYFVVNGFKPDDFLGLADKLVEGLLVAALFMHLRKTS